MPDPRCSVCSPLSRCRASLLNNFQVVVVYTIILFRCTMHPCPGPMGVGPPLTICGNDSAGVTIFVSWWRGGWWRFLRIILFLYFFHGAAACITEPGNNRPCRPFFPPPCPPPSVPSRPAHNAWEHHRPEARLLQGFPVWRCPAGCRGTASCVLLQRFCPWSPGRSTLVHPSSVYALPGGARPPGDCSSRRVPLPVSAVASDHAENRSPATVFIRSRSCERSLPPPRTVTVTSVTNFVTRMARVACAPLSTIRAVVRWRENYSPVIE